MSNIKKYNMFNEEAHQSDYYRFVLNDINIYIDEFIKTLKNKYDMSCWVLYTNRDSVSFEYFQSSNDSEENIIKIKKFLFEKAPYFRDLIIHRDDHRIIMKFVEVGDPIKFKFYH